jgi:hypothetical protein
MAFIAFSVAAYVRHRPARSNLELDGSVLTGRVEDVQRPEKVEARVVTHRVCKNEDESATASESESRSRGEDGSRSRT